MLHVRDCSGLLSNGDICPFPWCRKVKHLLYHLVSCQTDEDKICSICCPQNLSPAFTALAGLNTHRRKQYYVKRSKALAAAAVAKRQMAASSAVKIPAAHRPTATMQVARNVAQPHPHHYQKNQPQHVAVGQYRTPAVSTKITPAPTPSPGGPAYTSVPIPSTLAASSPTRLTEHHRKVITTNYASTNEVTTLQTQHQLQTSTPTNNTIHAANPLSPSLSALSAPSPASTNEPSSLQPLSSPSPAFTPTLPSTMSSLSVFNLEDPIVDIGDITLSSSDLHGDSFEHAAAGIHS